MQTVVYSDIEKDDRSLKFASNLDPRHFVFSLQYGEYQMDERSGFNVNQGF